ncbi:SDR family NAD(P)-dependent oxidoreductase [Streptomyces diacarni]|uniref:SDR family NAD(P)-dependent oxidoreductase n=1 Tax=Streptomyces diacarni TaxID=2800381 RepID=A0A367F7H2_9ACTN|nr:SDR family oxidoreductase [Streptomyces diacarni]RCG26318.1 SDR family NAD(P)-dependent oxidoreductase [Streptomyces diacarni]
MTENTSPASSAFRPGDGPRTVVVTGAGTGIGRAAARMFAALGSHVIAVGRREEPLHATAAEPGSGTITPVPADITAPHAPDRIVEAALQATGRLDVLVNNAAVVSDESLGAYTPTGMERQLATNLTAPVLLAQAALPALRAAPAGGVILNVSTALGQRAWPGNSLYAATKGALEVLTRGWAVDLAADGIRVAAVAPGAIDTPIGEHRGLDAQRRAALRKWQIDHTPLGRVGRPEEVASALVQLASDKASFLTGVVLPVDGGAVVA